MRNLILPNALLLALSSLTFFLPGESGDRIAFGATVTLALCVNLVIVIDFIPETSKTFPNLCNYYLASIFCSGFSLLLATISLNTHVWLLHRRNKATNESIMELANVATVASAQQFNLQPKKKQANGDVSNHRQRHSTMFFQSIRKIDLTLGMLYLTGTSIYSFLFINLTRG